MYLLGDRGRGDSCAQLLVPPSCDVTKFWFVKISIAIDRGQFRKVKNSVSAKTERISHRYRPYSFELFMLFLI